MTRLVCSAEHRHFFILLLLVSCCACVAAHHGTKTVDFKQQEGSVALFKKEQTVEALQPDGKDKNQKVTVLAFGAPVIVAAENAVVALAETTYSNTSSYNRYSHYSHYGHSGKKDVDPVAMYIRVKPSELKEYVFKKNGNEWRTQFVRQYTAGDKYFYRTSVGVAKHDKVYLLSVNRCINISGRDTSTESTKWFFRLSVGTVPNDKDKNIVWETPDSSNTALDKKFKDQSLTVDVDAHARTGDYAFLTKDKKVLFVVRARKDEQDNKKDGYAIIYLDDTKKGEVGKMWEVSYVQTARNSVSYFFPWNKSLMMVTQYKNGGNKVMESTNMGKDWTESTGSIARLWDNLREKNDFTSVTLEGNKSVVLFTGLRRLPAEKEEDASSTKAELHLWATDGNRLYDAGPILDNAKGFFHGGLLYTEDELFIIYKQSTGELQYSIFFMSLKNLMEKVKKELTAWAAQDKLLSERCVFADVDNKECITLTPTTGLVGFLSNNATGNGSGSNNEIWMDEYRFANATVTNGKKVDNGFRFSEPEARAVWAVGTNGTNQLYNFAGRGLTLMATVTIHEAGDRDNISLMGIGLKKGNGEGRRVELLCGRDQRWRLAMGSLVATLGDTECKLGKKYRVTLVYAKAACSLYVDMQFLGGVDRLFAGKPVQYNVSHLYFGADTVNPPDAVAVDTHVTVRNVHLYNWPFNHTDIALLAPKNLPAAQAVLDRDAGRLGTGGFTAAGRQNGVPGQTHGGSSSLQAGNGAVLMGPGGSEG